MDAPSGFNPNHSVLPQPGGAVPVIHEMRGGGDGVSGGVGVGVAVNTEDKIDLDNDSTVESKEVTEPKDTTGVTSIIDPDKKEISDDDYKKYLEEYDDLESYDTTFKIAFINQVKNSVCSKGTGDGVILSKNCWAITKYIRDMISKNIELTNTIDSILEQKKEKKKKIELEKLAALSAVDDAIKAAVDAIHATDAAWANQRIILNDVKSADVTIKNAAKVSLKSMNKTVKKSMELLKNILEKVQLAKSTSNSVLETIHNETFIEDSLIEINELYKKLSDKIQGLLEKVESSNLKRTDLFLFKDSIKKLNGKLRKIISKINETMTKKEVEELKTTMHTIQKELGVLSQKLVTILHGNLNIVGLSSKDEAIYAIEELINTAKEIIEAAKPIDSTRPSTKKIDDSIVSLLKSIDGAKEVIIKLKNDTSASVVSSEPPVVEPVVGQPVSVVQPVVEPVVEQPVSVVQPVVEQPAPPKSVPMPVPVPVTKPKSKSKTKSKAKTKKQLLLEEKVKEEELKVKEAERIVNEKLTSISTINNRLEDKQNELKLIPNPTKVKRGSPVYYQISALKNDINEIQQTLINETAELKKLEEAKTIAEKALEEAKNPKRSNIFGRFTRKNKKVSKNAIVTTAV